MVKKTVREEKGNLRKGSRRDEREMRRKWEEERGNDVKKEEG